MISVKSFTCTKPIEEEQDTVSSVEKATQEAVSSVEKAMQEWVNNGHKVVSASPQLVVNERFVHYVITAVAEQDEAVSERLH